MATRHLSGVRFADQFSGINAGAKIAAACADLPATGGIVDCCGFAGIQNITQDIFAGLSMPNLTLVVGAAQFHCTVTQTPSHVANVRIVGVASNGAVQASELNYGTRFIWDGANGGTVLLLDCVRDSCFEGFAIAPGAGTIGIGIRIDHATAPSGVFASMNNRFKAVTVYTSTCGVQVGNSSVANNSEHVFEDCTIVGAGTYGYYINHGQSKQIKILRGSISGRTYGGYINAGSAVFDTINLSSNGIDFIGASPIDTVTIQNCESENSGGFFSHTGGALGLWALTLIGNSYVPNLVVGNTLLFFGQAGILTMIGNDFSGGVYAAGHKISVQGTLAGTARVVSIGNIYGNPDALKNNPQAGNCDVVSLNDMAWTPTGIAQMSNILGNTYNGAIVLSNGANNDIASVISAYTTARTSFFRITGPTGAFSISGFTDGESGRTIKVFNTTAQQMTIKNLTGSSAANQIQTLSGGDVVLRTGTSIATFLYDITLQKWILESTN
jgi:hypothetical protein